MRMRNDPEAKSKLEKSGFLIETFPFKINNKMIIELGMGKGEMITTLAHENPSKTYIGIEKFATAAVKSLARAKNYNLSNFFIICNDIKKIPELLIGKVAEIWLTFSDPWPKAKHEKRRLTHKSFLKTYSKIITTNGVLKFKTDNDKLFTYSLESFKNNGWTIKIMTTDFHAHASSQGNVKTGYEKKWSSKGKNINYLEATFNH